MPEEMMDRLLPESIGPAVEMEKRALEETRLALRERTGSAAMALAASALVFACLPPEYNLWARVLRTGGLWAAGGLCVVSLGFWWRFLQASARLRGSGLQRPRGIRSRSAWQGGGYLASFAVVATICAALGYKLEMLMAPGLPGMLVALWLGERLGQIPNARKAMEEKSGPMSLFGKDDE
jgi:hypothetical protein